MRSVRIMSTWIPTRSISAKYFRIMLAVLVDWVEQGRAPGDLEVSEQKVAQPVTIERTLPLCQWPAWPRYKQGDAKVAASFECTR